MSTSVWQGTDSPGNPNWSDPANWQGGFVPESKNDITFPASVSNQLNVNDIPAGTAFGTISITMVDI